ncbi:isochorismatase family protein [Actinophytocola sp.]|uniref:isochorismatase family protein n=1 Tax=Actinophytocola sp. TaxID=1872138 RepID=UPI003D6BEC58
MPIPTITPYPMPTVADLPENVATWRIDPNRAVLLIHDMQQYFVDFFPPGAAPVTDLVDHIVALRAAADRLDIPVCYTAQPGNMTQEQRGLLRDFWGRGMAGSQEQRRVIDELAPQPADVVLTKWRYSAFARTDLTARLQAWGRDQLIVCGVYAHVGVLMTAADAFTQDIETFLVADAIADFSLAEHRMAIDYAARRCAMTICTDSLLADLAAAGADAEPATVGAGSGDR